MAKTVIFTGNRDEDNCNKWKRMYNNSFEMCKNLNKLMRANMLNSVR